MLYPVDTSEAFLSLRSIWRIVLFRFKAEIPFYSRSLPPGTGGGGWSFGGGHLRTDMGRSGFGDISGILVDDRK